VIEELSTRRPATAVASPHGKGDADAARMALIHARLAARGLGDPGAEADSTPFPVFTDNQPRALSSAQRRMWFAQLRAPDCADYNVCAGFRIVGDLDPDLLRASFDAVAERQAILRTVYRTDERGVPCQVVELDPEVPLDVVELPCGWTELSATVDALVARHGRLPFDLERDCPLRLVLVVVGPREHVLVLIAHHIAIDDLSWEPLLRGVAEHYRGATAGEAGVGDGPRVAFAEYAEWEQRRIAAGRFTESLRHWRETLTPWPDPVVLPAPTRVPEQPSTAGFRRRVTLPDRTRVALHDLANSTSSTLFMVTLACLEAVLSRYAPTRDIAVGTVVINRDRPELRDVVGNAGNTMLLRTRVADDPRFVDLVAEVRRVCVDAFTHQEVPFDLVVEDIRPQRRNDGSGLFNVMFTQRGRILRGVDIPGQHWSEFPVFNGTTRFDLAVEVLDDTDGLVLTATGAASAFTVSDLDRLLGHLGVLIEEAVAGPERRVSELPLLTEAEHTRIVHEWNATDRPEYLPTTTLTGLVDSQVAATPDACAVVASDVELSYAELDAAANRLAHHLRARGVPSGGYVGVLLPRSPELITSLLAVLKAGAAFVALDPAWPALRVTEITGDAGLAAVVTNGDMVDGLTIGAPVVDLAAEAGEISARESHPPEVPVGLDDVAYVVYTSGSTGTPKGVMITHRGIVNRLPWQVDLLGLSSVDAVLHKAPMSFDISVNEIFLPLVAGARLVLATPGGEGDVSHLLATITRHRVTFVYVVSSLLDVMIDRHDAAAAFASLRHVWCGGEAMTAELYQRFRRRSTARLYHGYGPAEATVGVTCRVYDSVEHVRDVTIGRPNPNTRIHLLDPHGNPVPVGVTGELYIGGLPLARGYLNDPARTGERFVVDPFQGGDERLYRTGDLARYRSDGQIEFVGRLDNQVKIGGRRVELEEIEAKLVAHPDVRHAVVELRAAGARGQVLVGHVAVGESTVSAGELVSWLDRRLPGYMVPSVVIPAAELPIQASGKVDRAALAAVPLPEFDRVGTAYVAPTGDVQGTVADIWRAVLDVDEVGADDNFFDRGGHSLLVLRVQAEIRSRLGHDISVVDLFDSPTVRMIAARISPETRHGEDNEELRRVAGLARRQRRIRTLRTTGDFTSEVAHHDGR
jgi:amino acid adenylation domain-containing protein